MKSIILLSLILIIGSGIFVATTLLPRAVITIYPKTNETKHTKDIILSSKIETPDYVRLSLPARIVEEELTVTKQFENASGTTVQDFAKGSITFMNKQNEEQRLLPKTQMRHIDSGMIFLTDTPVAIPALGTLTVTVTAKEKGAAGDVAPGAFVVEKFSPSLQAAVPAQSDVAFSGGESADSEISQEALDAAQTAVVEQAKTDALAKLSAQANGAAIRPDLLNIEILSQNISATAGSRAHTYTAQASVKARGFVVSTHDIISLLTLTLRGNVAPDEEFISYDASSFSLAITQTDWEAGQAKVSASLTGIYAKKIGTNEINTDNIPGLSEQEIIEHFTKIPNIGSVEVALSPFWVKSAPSKQNQIEVRIENAK